ncbi:RelA/SpoT family protein [Patescibacteria group bacterium]
MSENNNQTTKNRSNSELVRKAVEIAKSTHGDQKRKTGEPYIHHPLKVAKILSEMRLDDETVAAGILHDCVEDGDITIAEIEAKFGKGVARLVNGVTKLDKISFTGDREAYSIENLRRMFLAMSEDVRVILIKLADRLHNMRSLAYHTPENQQRIARETLEIYSPIADRLCMGELKGTLEDLAFPYIYPEEYKWIRDHLTSAYTDRQRSTSRVLRLVRKELARNKVDLLDTHGRAKHLFSLYKKLMQTDMDVTRIYDLVALRVVVKDVEECYRTLGVIHQKWKPLIGRIKDYIATPKPNGYQSIHTTIISNLDDEIFELQIRTAKMHAEAEYGIAAHWYYDSQQSESKPMKSKTRQWFSQLTKRQPGQGSFTNLPWIKQITELEEEIKKPREFMKSLHSDILKDHIIILTPKGHIRTLPIGATPVDFAYSIHTDVGNNCIAAKINNELVPLNTHIKNGDIVKIVTSQTTNGPKRQWLDFVATSQARNKILDWFKNLDQKENIKYGKDSLEQALNQKYHVSLRRVKRKLIFAASKLNLQDLDEVFSSIGRGELTAQKVLKIMFPEKEGKQKEKFIIFEKGITHLYRGGKRIAVKPANCCHPKKGDLIVGEIQTKAINVHKKDCEHLNKIPADKTREVSWSKSETAGDQEKIKMKFYSRSGLLRDVAAAIAKDDSNVIEFKIEDMTDESEVINAYLLLEYRNKKSLANALRSIRKIDNIVSVETA